MAPPDEKLKQASPNKVQRTGNVVLDKINKQVEQQRSYIFNESLDIDLNSEDSTEKDQEEVKTPVKETAGSQEKGDLLNE